MQSDFKGKKRPYSRPAATKVTQEQARRFVADRVTCSDQEAAHFVESLRAKNSSNGNARHSSEKGHALPI
jgi:hypothetical protein